MSSINLLACGSLRALGPQGSSSLQPSKPFVIRRHCCAIAPGQPLGPRVLAGRTGFTAWVPLILKRVLSGGISGARCWEAVSSLARWCLNPVNGLLRCGNMLQPSHSKSLSFRTCGKDSGTGWGQDSWQEAGHGFTRAVSR